MCYVFYSRAVTSSRPWVRHQHKEVDHESASLIGENGLKGIALIIVGTTGVGFTQTKVSNKWSNSLENKRGGRINQRHQGATPAKR